MIQRIDLVEVTVLIWMMKYLNFSRGVLSWSLWKILGKCCPSFPALLPEQIQDDGTGRSRGYPLRTEYLVCLLSKGLDIRYGYNLFAEEISSSGITLSPRFAFESVTKTLHGSMMVGADGMLNIGKYEPCFQ
jgi:hypothetical protein